MPALAAIPFVGKALAALKAGGAAKAGMGAYKALSGAGVPKGVARFAGDKLMKVGRGLTPGGFAKNLGVPMTKSDLAMTVAPDLLFGGMAAVMTPGDIVDKTIAGVGSAAGGVAGGLGTRGLLGPKSGLGILGAEMVGGIGGDMVGMGVADSIIRAKHGGMTPMEQQYAAQDEAYKQQLYDQFLAEQGLG
jgi:hypothetical protein